MAASERIPVWTVGDRMRKARETSRIKVAAMAAELGCDPDTVSNYERGRTRPRRSVLLAYEQLTGVPVAWIEGDEGSPRRRSADPMVNFRWSSIRRPGTMRTARQERREAVADASPIGSSKSMSAA